MSRPLEGCWNRPVLILCSSLQSFTIAPSPHSVLILAYGLFVPWTTVGPNLHPEIIRRVPPLLIQWQCQSQAWIKSEVDANGHTLTLNWNWNAWLSDSEVSIFYVISMLFFLPTNPLTKAWFIARETERKLAIGCLWVNIYHITLSL